MQEEYSKLIKKKEAEQNNYKDYYDLTHVDITYEIGDKVLVLYDTPIKSSLMPRWEGPFTIINQREAYEVRVFLKSALLSDIEFKTILFKLFILSILSFNLCTFLKSSRPTQTRKIVLKCCVFDKGADNGELG